MIAVHLNYLRRPVGTYHNPWHNFPQVYNCQVADAKKEGIEAGQKAGDADLRAAQANQRAASLEVAAQNLRLANLRLEAQIAPRRISETVCHQIAVSLAQFTGLTVEVGSYALDAESTVLAKQLLSCLQLAQINAVDRTMSVSSIGGLNFGIVLLEKNAQLGSALREELIKANLWVAPHGTQLVMGAGMSVGPMPGQSSANATIFVGVKPITQ